MGLVMCAALLEWFLWLVKIPLDKLPYWIRILISWQAAFLYCLVKVFQKADAWHIRVLALFMMIIFTALR